MSDERHPPIRGRGASTNPAGRFEPRWFESEEDPAEVPPPETQVFVDATRGIIAHNDSPDIGFSQSINPYRGCEHGCSYCFARPTHAFLNLSPGLDFETKIFTKPDASRLLREELARPRYVCSPIALGTNTDPYQPLERRLRITRGILEVLAEHEHPFTIVTKSALVVRDLDLIAPAAARRQAAVHLSITTLDPGLASRMEPRAATPARRLDALRALAEAGVPCGVMAAPMIPGLNDHELEKILEAARDAGATSAGWVLLRLPHELKGLFESWLTLHEPTQADKVLSRIRETRGGGLYDARFGSRQRGEGVYADMLARRFKVAAGRLGLDRRHEPLDVSRFRKPGPKGLFDR
ncbi:MAG TPA: PA0069 family radical SAM protein [Candidatus Polarisedimenticolaceae bacterium]|nr:PA0069 family radical SAM protein [Candidatus Polarisedimenticolaceae bacterium]